MIELDSVSKVYRVGVEKICALDALTLGIAENDYVAVMGPSGSGKSTLMNILGCLDRPTGGQYYLDGKLIHRLGGHALARIRNERIGFVFQSFELLPRLNALHNVELPLLYSGLGWLARRRQARAALDRVGLTDRIKHRPNQLSGGEKQRVAIARALVVQPRLLLADEPTGNLDSRTSDEILALFDRLHAEGQTIVMVTHEEEVAAHATRILRMRDGRLASDLTAAEDRAHRGNIDGPPDKAKESRP